MAHEQDMHIIVVGNRVTVKQFSYPDLNKYTMDQLLAVLEHADPTRAAVLDKAVQLLRVHLQQNGNIPTIRGRICCHGQEDGPNVVG